MCWCCAGEQKRQLGQITSPVTPPIPSFCNSRVGLVHPLVAKRRMSWPSYKQGCVWVLSPKHKSEKRLEYYNYHSDHSREKKTEPVDKVATQREFWVLHTALHGSSSYREAVFKMLSNKESLEQITVATPGLSSNPIVLGVLLNKDLFSIFADPSMLDTLVPAYLTLVNAIILVLHSVAGSTPTLGADASSWSTPSSSYQDMPGGFLCEGLSDDEEDFHPSTWSTTSSSTSSCHLASIGYSRPKSITQSELELASTPRSSSHTETPGTQGHSSGTLPMSSRVQSGTSITNDLF
ncbi:Ubiquitin-like protein 7 [Fukomys damarensis]|uniref:Ubiquitin-like protein 7 n=1 Tax=Fukomys damarensis TaxID=885580 RepID=A0A091CQL2_FUKDA|nr:Ubiquitin-like protein 7 [Fukomys damarensis]